MPASINGCGTTWYGASDCGKDGSYIVTEWIVFLFIPLIPLGSKRVWPMPKEQKPWWKASLGKTPCRTSIRARWSGFVTALAKGEEVDTRISISSNLAQAIQSGAVRTVNVRYLPESASEVEIVDQRWRGSSARAS